ncbi:MHC class I antigen [Pelobates cultripes]|uniref:MHC class I antigen n=1 Tax=Pelobates cultripes TaxID=61616 RepID=A0AAD1T385_PELCU|nr:MHC class I antigen [Pelobates cultripes]
MASPNFWRNLQLELWSDENLMRNTTLGNGTQQYIHGCTETSNGTFQYYFRNAFNGIELLRFDTDTGNYSSEIDGIQEIVDALNENRTANKLRTEELTSFCENVTKFLVMNGQEYIHRKVAPDVIVRSSGDTLYCKAYGHYPRKIDIIWYKNGQIIPDGELEMLTLPLTDQTYLSSVSVNISSISEDAYICLVNHSSLEGPTSILWRKSGLMASSPSNSNINVIPSIGIVILITLLVILFVLASVFGFIMWEKGRKARMGSVFNNDPSS